MNKLIDMIGTVWGSWTVLERVPNKGNRATWKCSCICGFTVAIEGSYLRDGRTTKCKKCYLYKHGHSKHNNKSPTYSTWRAMKRRCLDPNNNNYHNYGGRGIIVCERWLNNFKAFLEDMGEKPKGTSIDRINTNGNYEPSNCRWATSKEQRSNQRKKSK